MIKYMVTGSPRFLSHAEMLRVLQRACTRAGINIKYTQGFNPHPRLSLPLPKPVGVESNEELLCLRIYPDPLQKSGYPDELKTISIESRISTALSEQLPEGCDVLSVSITEGRTSFQPLSAIYIFAVHKESINEKLKTTIDNLMTSESINFQRQTDKNGSKPKNLDIRGFLKSINVDGNDIIVECRISPAGSIRIEEILELLGLNAEMLEMPIKRTGIQWQIN